MAGGGRAEEAAWEPAELAPADLLNSFDQTALYVHADTVRMAKAASKMGQLACESHSGPPPARFVRCKSGMIATCGELSACVVSLHQIAGLPPPRRRHRRSASAARELTFAESWCVAPLQWGCTCLFHACAVSCTYCWIVQRRQLRRCCGATATRPRASWRTWSASASTSSSCCYRLVSSPCQRMRGFGYFTWLVRRKNGREEGRCGPGGPGQTRRQTRRSGGGCGQRHHPCAGRVRPGRSPAWTAPPPLLAPPPYPVHTSLQLRPRGFQPGPPNRSPPMPAPSLRARSAAPGHPPPLAQALLR